MEICFLILWGFVSRARTFLCLHLSILDKHTPGIQYAQKIDARAGEYLCSIFSQKLLIFSSRYGKIK